MKPAEILGMLEEAAGTRMYENKKDGALRTLDKKQLKVDEIEKARSPHLTEGGGYGTGTTISGVQLVPRAGGMQSIQRVWRVYKPRCH